MTSFVDVWHTRPRDADEATLAACAALLTDDERRRYAAYIFERNKLEYLVTRGLARAVLATYVGVAPSALVFQRDAHGRPDLAPVTRLRFNLANTVDLVVCAVSDGCEIGVDTESLARADDILAIGEAAFTSREIAALAALALPARRRAAVARWTLKEAYVKARGVGIALPVDAVDIEIAGDLRVVNASFGPALEDTPARWSFATVELEDHLASVCVEAQSCELRAARAELGALLASVPFA